MFWKGLGISAILGFGITVLLGVLFVGTPWTLPILAPYLSILTPVALYIVIYYGVYYAVSAAVKPSQEDIADKMEKILKAITYPEFKAEMEKRGLW